MLLGVRTERLDDGTARGDLVAYCLDRAVYVFGSYVETDMEEAEFKVDPPDAKTKAKIAKVRAARTAVLQAYLGGSPSQRYADPAKIGKRSGGTQEIVWKAGSNG